MFQYLLYKGKITAVLVLITLNFLGNWFLTCTDASHI